MARTNDKLQNIAENNFLVYDTKAKAYHAVVLQPTKGFFKITTFAVIQFLTGVNDFLRDTNYRIISNLISKLAMYQIVTVRNEHQDIKIELNREEIETMRKLLEARMRHCEHERDEKSENFNPDTYISQKLLLLDIREWLMCSSIELREPIEEDIIAN